LSAVKTSQQKEKDATSIANANHHIFMFFAIIFSKQFLSAIEFGIIESKRDLLNHNKIVILKNKDLTGFQNLLGLKIFFLKLIKTSFHYKEIK